MCALTGQKLGAESLAYKTSQLSLLIPFLEWQKRRWTDSKALKEAVPYRIAEPCLFYMVQIRIWFRIQIRNPGILNETYTL